MATLNDLIEKLNTLYSTRPKKYKDGQNDATECYYFHEGVGDELVDEIGDLAMDLLHYTENGTIYQNYENHRKMKEAGYDVFAGEKDSFGWLSGCIQKHGDERIVVYG